MHNMRGAAFGWFTNRKPFLLELEGKSGRLLNYTRSVGKTRGNRFNSVINSSLFNGSNHQNMQRRNISDYLQLSVHQDGDCHGLRLQVSHWCLENYPTCFNSLFYSYLNYSIFMFHHINFHNICFACVKIYEQFSSQRQVLAPEADLLYWCHRWCTTVAVRRWKASACWRFVPLSWHGY